MSSDKKSSGVRLTDRDRQSLLAVAQLRAIRLDDLAVLLGSGKPIASRTTREVAARWVQCGLAQTHRIGVGPSVVTLSAYGARLAGVPSDWPQGMPSWSTIPHTLTTAAVSVRYRVSDQVAGQWQRPAQRVGHHTPDGLIVGATATCAVEIELNRKSGERWTTIVNQLLDDYGLAHYWTTKPVAASFGAWVAASLPDADARRITVYPLGELAR